jgi:hypothetical protein
VQLAADHPGDELARRRLGNRRGDDTLAVAEDGHPVGDPLDLVELVGDVDDRHPPRLELRDHPEEGVDLGRAEGGGRLVHHDQPGLPRQRPRDLDHLLLGDPQLADRQAGSISSPRSASNARVRLRMAAKSTSPRGVFG